MAKLRFLTGGESHGEQLTAMLEGIPAGLPIDTADIDALLGERQKGYGRSARQKIENDRVEIKGGVRHGITTGAPIVLVIKNKDHESWRTVMSISKLDLSKLNTEALTELKKKSVKRYRPGHADFAGTFKFKHADVRDVIERASARETAARVAVGAIARACLETLSIRCATIVTAIGTIASDISPALLASMPIDEMCSVSRESQVGAIGHRDEQDMIAEIKQAAAQGESLGGKVTVVVDGLPIGLGSYTQWDQRLDGKLAQALMSIQAIKAVEIGAGCAQSAIPGSQVHDPITRSGDQISRPSNNAGGLEGGMTNGERLIISGYMKPIPTLIKGLPSLSHPGLQNDRAHYERSDVCAVRACSIVAGSMVCLSLLDAVLEKFGGDHMDDLQAALASYKKRCEPGQS